MWSEGWWEWWGGEKVSGGEVEMKWVGWWVVIELCAVMASVEAVCAAVVAVAAAEAMAEVVMMAE